MMILDLQFLDLEDEIMPPIKKLEFPKLLMLFLSSINQVRIFALKGKQN